MKKILQWMTGGLAGALLVAACNSGSGQQAVIGVVDNVVGGALDMAGGTSPPNILLIIADDLGLDATPGYPLGAEKADMPNLVGLQGEGVTFDNFWAYPVCAPTRASILTGRHGVRTGVLSVGEGGSGIGLDELSIQRLLGESTAYGNAVVGKWHLSDEANGGVDNPNNMGIDHYIGLLLGAHEDYWSMRYVENGQRASTTQYSTSFFTDQAIAWLQGQSAPWFLWVAYTAPHTPFHLPPADLHSYTELEDTEAAIAADPLPYYLAMSQALDTEMGRLLAEVDRRNTVVIFIGDNGPPGRVAQAPLQLGQAKNTLYQGGIQVPLVVAGPGIGRPGQREASLVSSTDLFATIADLAGADMDRVPSDSRSFKGLLQGTGADHRDYVYAQLESQGQAAWTVRDGRYKLIDFGDGSTALYDLQADPYEEGAPLEAEGALEQAWTRLDSAARAIQARP
ncbi:MAG: sulfatase-like hydrolase/transferase [Candidatus Latescibacteria bacterium]|nr:sulfatase-like hydrolase/transferase [Candidatus Latescibacterota bacterium]